MVARWPQCSRPHGHSYVVDLHLDPAAGASVHDAAAVVFGDCRMALSRARSTAVVRGAYLWITAGRAPTDTWHLEDVGIEDLQSGFECLSIRRDAAETALLGRQAA